MPGLIWRLKNNLAGHFARSRPVHPPSGMYKFRYCWHRKPTSSIIKKPCFGTLFHNTQHI